MIVNVGSIGGKVALPWMTSVQRLEICAGLTHRRAAHGAAARRRPHHAGLPGLREDRLSEECQRRPGARKVQQGAPVRHHRGTSAPGPSAGVWSAMRAPSLRRARAGFSCSPCGCFPRSWNPHGGDERNGMILRLKRTPGIYVVGFMGAGKVHRGPPSGPSAGLELLRYRRRNRGRRKDGRSRRSLRRAARPEFRRIESGNHPPARPLDRTRPSRGAGARRRRLHVAGEPRAAREQRHQRLAGLPFEKCRSGASPQATHRAPGPRSRAFAALYQTRREPTAWPTSA